MDLNCCAVSHRVELLPSVVAPLRWVILRPGVVVGSFINDWRVPFHVVIMLGDPPIIVILRWSHVLASLLLRPQLHFNWLLLLWFAKVTLTRFFRGILLYDLFLLLPLVVLVILAADISQPFTLALKFFLLFFLYFFLLLLLLENPNVNCIFSLIINFCHFIVSVLLAL